MIIQENASPARLETTPPPVDISQTLARIVVKEIKISNKGLSSYNLGHLIELDDTYKFMVAKRGVNFYILASASELGFRSKKHLEHFTRHLENTMKRGRLSRRKLTAAEIAGGAAR